MAVTSANAVPGTDRPARVRPVVTALRGLLSTSSALAAHWDDLDPARRRRALEEVISTAKDLQRLAGIGDADEVRPGFDPLGELTPREVEILQALSAGASTAAIARSFGIRTSTVRSHVKSILSKLGVHSRIEAIARAAEQPRPLADA